MRGWMLGVLLVLAGAASAQTAAESSRVIWRFGGQENWTIWWPAERGAPVFSCAKDGEAALVTVQTTSTDQSLGYFEPNLKGTVVLHKAVGFGLTVDLLAGEAVELSPMLIDATSELLVLRPTRLKPGRNELTWRIPEDISTSYSYNGSPVNRVPDGDLKLWELSIIKPKDTPEARLRLSEATCRERKPLVEFLGVGLETGHPLALVVLPAATERPELVVRNSYEQPVTCELATTVNLLGTPTGAKQALTVPGKGETRVAIADADPRQGVRYVDWTLSAGGDSAAGRLSYAKVRPNVKQPGRKDGFLFSICTHASWWAPEVREREFLAMSLIGTEIVRDGPGWGQIEGGERGRFDWAPMDQMVAVADKYNLELQGNFGSIPRWAAPEKAAASGNFLDYIFCAPERGWDRFEVFAHDFVARYRDKIRYWEVGNEPDLDFFWKGTTDEYIRYLRIAYQQGKKADPKAVIMTGGFSGIGPHDGKKLNPHMQDKVIAAAQDSFDVHAFHQHGGFDYFQKVVDVELPKLRAVLRSPKPLYFNETAMYSSSIGELAQAELLYKKLLLAWSRGAIGYTWYDLRNDGDDPREPEHNFGLITHDFHPKAAYVAFNTLTSLLGDKKHAQRLELGADTYVSLYSGAKDHVVAGWVEKDTEPDKVVALRVGAGASAVTVDLMGNEQPLTVAQGVIFWSVTHQCRYLVVRGAAQAPVFAGQPVTPPAQVNAALGQVVTLRAKVVNPLSTAVTLNTRFVLPACLQPRSPVAREMRLAPGAHATVELPVLPGRRPADAPYDKPVQASLRYGFAGTPFAGEMAVPVMLDLVVDSGSLAAKEPVFALRRDDQVTNTFANDPSRAEYAWHGPTDLSADVWLGVTGGDLVLRIKARDDRHQQPNTPAEMWKADCVQFAFVGPGQPSQWEIGVARADDGRTLVATWMVPAGQTDPIAAVKATTASRPDGVDYDIRLPLAVFGLTKASLAQGLRFNLIVNDADLGPREGWIAIAPGLGDRKDPSVYPTVTFR